MLKLFVSFLAVLSMSAFSNSIKMHTDHKSGFSFAYYNLTLKQDTRKSDLFRHSFISGTPPQAVTILYKKESSDKLITDFLEEEKESIALGGYLNEVKVIEYTADDFEAFEVTRHTRNITIRWFVFQKTNDTNIYSFWLMEDNRIHAENRNAVFTYNRMIETLTILQ